MSDDTKPFEGIWHSAYWFPSNDHSGEDASEYEVVARSDGNQLVLESKPDSSGAYILIRLSFDGEIATGTWHETTAPEGPFKGMIYSGALQVLVSKDLQTMEGKWVGIGRDYQLNRPDIFTGNWKLTKQAA
jgi:lipocalin